MFAKINKNYNLHTSDGRVDPMIAVAISLV